jgi:hypothetical protein
MEVEYAILCVFCIGNHVQPHSVLNFLPPDVDARSEFLFFEAQVGMVAC